ncbi:cinnamoyl-CoA reductase-like SNL6 [Mangifera indica]|uniref:cinnamoyl-CoA reductase-like SNL6 n=1 Tax=Mangifera indica TaxID=29780 RepID=UPI001CFBF293|nr:cinnamoyl-CoA reductase-like SNL6 [Mangifera indica]
MVMEPVVAGSELLELHFAALSEGQKSCKNVKGFTSHAGLKGREGKLMVCVTGGNSYLGSCIVKELLAHSYLVRVIIQNPVDFEDVKRLFREEEMNQLESVVVAKMGNLVGLCEAFKGCHAVFHTSSFIDPHGVSGYSEQMAFLETEGARNVIEACGKTAYVKRCIFTSSLLASIWNIDKVDAIVDESCWSNEDFCRENKLWLALGKTQAEKVSWSKSREMKVKLVTVCPGLLMAPSFPNAHKETSLPYLKGGQLMLQKGLLATSDVKKVAEAHVHLYEAMDFGACGRYHCFERIIQSLEEAVKLESELNMPGLLSEAHTDEVDSNKLSNSRLAKLLHQTSQRLSCKQ